MKTGWERENRTRFDEIVGNYDRIRWEYPAALYEDVFAYAGKGGKSALEIGAGTGKATVPFLGAGYSVTAVEIGENMAKFLADRFQSGAEFKVILSPFEDAALPEDSYDLVYAATAFHWVDAEVGCPKVFRLLKDGGVFALFRYKAIPPKEGEVYEEIQRLYDKHYYSFHPKFDPPPGLADRTDADYFTPAELYASFRFESMEEYGFREVTKKLYRASRSYQADEYLMLLDTYPDHRALPEENRAALCAGIREAIVKHGGEHTLDFAFQLYMGRKM